MWFCVILCVWLAVEDSVWGLSMVKAWILGRFGKEIGDGGYWKGLRCRHVDHWRNNHINSGVSKILVSHHHPHEHRLEQRKQQITTCLSRCILNSCFGRRRGLFMFSHEINELFLDAGLCDIFLYALQSCDRHILQLTRVYAKECICILFWRVAFGSCLRIVRLKRILQCFAAFVPLTSTPETLPSGSSTLMLPATEVMIITATRIAKPLELCILTAGGWRTDWRRGGTAISCHWSSRRVAINDGMA